MDYAEYIADLSALSPDEKDKARNIIDGNALGGISEIAGIPSIHFVMNPSTLLSLSSVLPTGIRFTRLNR